MKTMGRTLRDLHFDHLALGKSFRNMRPDWWGWRFGALYQTHIASHAHLNR
jgi:hypothetical protein